MAARDSLADRVLPLFDRTHGPLTTGLVVAFAAVLGLYASWLTADFGARTVAFAAAAVGVGYVLYGEPTRRAVVARGLYVLAAFVAATPFVYELSILLGGGYAGVGSPWQHVLSVTDLLFVLLFLVVAAVPALVAYRLTTGPFLPRIRRRLTRRRSG